jgi:HAMP domain-containing protein
MSVDPDLRLIVVFLVQHNGFPGPDGNQAYPTFLKAAVASVKKPPAPPTAPQFPHQEVRHGQPLQTACQVLEGLVAQPFCPAQPAGRDEQLPPGQVGIEVGLFRNVAELLPVCGKVFLNFAAVELNQPSRRLEQSGQHFHRGALAGTVGAKASEHLTWAQRE